MSGQNGENNGINAEQIQFWGSERGEPWMVFQNELDAAFEPILVHLIGQSGIQSGDIVLDIGCGTGASTVDIASTIGPEGHVDSFDISQPFLLRAKQRCLELGLLNAETILGDAQIYDFKPAFYDVMISRFGTMFFADSVAAFRNMVKALKPNAKMVFATWGDFEDNPWFTLPRQAATDRLGPLDMGNLDAPGPFAFRSLERTLGLLQEAGLTDCEGVNYQVDLSPQGSVEQVAKLATSVGSATRITREHDGNKDDVLAISAAIADRFALFETTKGVRIPASINIYEARIR